MSTSFEGEKRLILGRLYQNYQQNIDSTTEDDFLAMKIPIDQIRYSLKDLEAQDLVQIAKSNSGIQHIQITERGINKIEESCSCD